jgi:broad specificity phosphatase PhoE
MRTTLYLIRHAATEANLANPPRLQGRKHDPPLAKIGVRQAEATSKFLADRALVACYTSPLLRAQQTATIVAAPHGVSPQAVPALTECELGRWEGLTWQEVRYFNATEYRDFMADPAAHGYPGGENFQQVHDRASAAFESILARHEGQNVLIVAHHVVNRIYLAGLLGLPVAHARQVSLDNCGISVVTLEGGNSTVSMLNAVQHLQDVAA